jgi:hypothetical protein
MFFIGDGSPFFKSRGLKPFKGLVAVRMFMKTKDKDKAVIGKKRFLFKQ